MSSFSSRHEVPSVMIGESVESGSGERRAERAFDFGESGACVCSHDLNPHLWV